MTRVSRAVKVEKRWRMQGITGFTSRMSRAFFIFGGPVGAERTPLSGRSSPGPSKGGGGKVQVRRGQTAQRFLARSY